MPNNLRTVIIDLIEGNSIQVETGLNKTKPIQLLKGVTQGSPLSPSLFNLAINGTVKELTEEEVSKEFGFTLMPELPNISALAFADDIAILGKDEESTQELINITINSFMAIGLNINPSKSKIINICDGKLTEGSLILPCGKSIECLKNGEVVKYLGVTFSDEIILDKNKIIKKLDNDLISLVASNLLKSDQKLNIINQFI